MIVLGIGGYSHDSAAALVVDGKVVAAVAEERLSRQKHQGGVPHRAAAFCLEQAGLHPDELTDIVCYMRPGLRLARRLPYRVSRMPQHLLYSLGFMTYELVHNAQYVWGMRALRGRTTRLHFAEHHPAHAASAFYPSPFEEAALLSLDYVGEWAATWAGIGQGTEIRRLRSRHYPHSLGVFYSAITDYLGFTRASDEYKVMGLASYGAPEYLDDFRRIVRQQPDGWYDIDLSWVAWHYLPGSRRGYFSRRFLERFGPPRRRGEPIETRHRNIAASAQAVLEEVALGLAHWLHKTSRQTKLCLAGGVALNCSMNGRLRREGPFEDIWIQPAAGDDGIAIGAALQLYYRQTGAAREYEMTHAYLGPRFTPEAVREALDMAKLPYQSPPSMVEATAELLAAGKIVGWFQGAMEFGPRALGGRSILADPTRPEMQDLLNKYVKHREEFRPFAPSVVAERAGEFFEGCHDSPFMLFVHPVRAEQQARLPAITHVDGTARVQTVTAAQNPDYYALLQAFERRRGVPVLLNTSFNVMGEPIVNTPADAVRCFYSTGIDALAIGPYLLVK